MPFELTETQKHIVEAAKKISSKFDDSYWLDLDLKSEFPSKFYDEVAKSGWLGMCMPEEYGGANLEKKHQVMLRYVKELTKNPSDVNKKSRDELSKNGFSDRDIWDISLITGFFNMTNRLAIATEMEPNDIYHSSHR